MEHESFENETIAAFLNDNFVSIKLDREERQKNIKSRNIHLSVYTITHEAEFTRAIALGARAVVTDIPHELVEMRNKLYPL